MKRLTTILLLLLAGACGDSSADTESSTGDATSSTTPVAEPCTPGESIACACTDGGEGAQVCADDGLSFAECVCEPGGSTEGEAETGSDTESTTDDTTGEPVEPAPRWVLRDKDGVEVDAVVEPRCVNGAPVDECTSPSIPPPCFWAWSVEGEYRSVVYGLSTGTFAECTTKLRDSFMYPGAIFADPSCTEPLLGHVLDGFNSWLVVDGVVYEGDPRTYQEVEPFGIVGQDCTQFEGAIGVASPVPVDKALHTVPGAPFTLEYE